MILENVLILHANQILMAPRYIYYRNQTRDIPFDVNANWLKEWEENNIKELKRWANEYKQLIWC